MRSHFQVWFLASFAVCGMAHAQFLPTSAGPHQYHDAANWFGGYANGEFRQTLQADQTVTMGGGPAGPMLLAFDGNFDFTLRSNFSEGLLYLAGDLTMDSVTGGRTATIGSEAALGALTVRLGAPRTFTVGATDTLRLRNGVIGGSDGWRKVGAGTIELGGLSSYSGATVVEAGLLRLAPGASLPAAAPLVLHLGATLDLAGTSQTVRNLSGLGGTVRLGGGMLTVGAGAGTFAGSIEGAGGLVKRGAGTITTLSGVNDFTGPVTFAGGMLKVSADRQLGAAPSALAAQLFFQGGGLQLGGSFDLDPRRTITLGSGGWIDTNGFATAYEGAINGSGYFQKRGLGALRLAGAGTYTGETYVEAGTLVLDFAADARAKTGAASQLSLGPAVLRLEGGTSTPSVQSFAALTIYNGAASIQVESGEGQTAQLDLGGVTRTGGATVDFLLPAAGSVTTTTTNRLGILGGYATVGGTDWARNDGTGRIARFTAYDADSLATGANADLTTSRTLGVSANPNSLRFHTPAAVQLALDSPVTLTLGTPGNAGGILVTSAVGNHPVQVAGGTLTSAGVDLVVLQNNTAHPVTIASRIVDGSSAIGLTKSGPGTLILTGANTFTGRTTVNGGTLRLSAGGSLRAGTQVVLNAAGVLELGGMAQTLSYLYGGPETRILLGSSTLTVGGNSLTEGSIEGSGGLVVDGDFFTALRLRGTNTYSGPTVLRSGALYVDRAESLSAASPLVFAGGTLVLEDVALRRENFTGAANARISGSGAVIAGAGDGIFAGQLGGGLALVKDGAGTTTVLTGENSHGGGTTLKAGTLRILSDRALGIEPVVTGTNLTFDGGTLQLGADIFRIHENRGVRLESGGGTIDTNSFRTYLRGVISGPGALTKIGAGTLELSGLVPNDFAGGLTVKEGSVSAFRPEGFGAVGQSVVLDGGALEYSSGTFARHLTLGPSGGALRGGNSTTFAGVIDGPGALTIEQANSITLTGANRYEGGTKVGQGGFLRVQGGQRGLGTGPVTVQRGGVLGLGSADDLPAGELVRLEPGGALGLFDSALDPATVLDPATSTGGFLQIATPSYSRALDMAAIGDGQLTLGGLGFSAYTAPTLGPGRDGVHRFGVVRSFGYRELTLTGHDNVLTGTSAVIVGGGSSEPGGALLLMNANDFTGGTRLVLGTLQIGHPSALGTGPLTLAGGAFAPFYPGFVIANALRVEAEGFLGLDTYFRVPFTLAGPVDLLGASRRLTIPSEVTFTGNVANGTLEKAGAGRLILAGDNRSTDGIIVSSGTVRATNVLALGSSGVRLAGGSLELATGLGPVANPLELTRSSGLQLCDGVTLTGQIAHSALTVSSLTVTVPEGSATIAEPILDHGELSLSKSGPGALLLPAANTFTGSTTLREGALVVFSDASLGASPSFRGSSLFFKGGTLRAGASFTLDRTRGIYLFPPNHGSQPAGLVATVDTAGFDVTISGNIVGDADFVKTGAGTLTLKEGSSHGGLTAVLGGRLKLGPEARLFRSGEVRLAAGAIFDLSENGGHDFIGGQEKLSGEGTVVGGVWLAPGSIVTPGVAAGDMGTLTFDTLRLDGTYLADLDHTGRRDLLSIDGDLTLGLGADLTVHTVDLAFGPYVLVRYGGRLAGEFASLSLPPNYVIDYGTGEGSQITIVPEPQTFALLSAGAALLTCGLDRRVRRMRLY